MSPQKIPVNHNVITWDFTNQDGYKTSTTTGQVELPSGVWAMLAGEGQQDGDINGSDKIIWQNDNGRFFLYMLGDYNNNGKFSGVPK